MRVNASQDSLGAVARGLSPLFALDLILKDLVVVLRYQDANGERHELESCPRLSSYVGIYSNFIDG